MSVSHAVLSAPLDAHFDIATFQLELGNIFFDEEFDEFFKLFLIHSDLRCDVRYDVRWDGLQFPPAPEPWVRKESRTGNCPAELPTH